MSRFIPYMDGMGMGITNSVHKKKYRLNLNTLVFHGSYWQRKFNGIFWTHRIFHIECGGSSLSGGRSAE